MSTGEFAEARLDHVIKILTSTDLSTVTPKRFYAPPSTC
jgi:hypothetical protein